jgi:hypothetical protein
MIKNFLFGLGLLSLALASGCAKGGNGVVPPQPSIDVSITSPQNTNAGAIYPTQALTLTAKVSNATTTAVTWTCTPTADCANFTPVTPATTPATATYVAPAAAGSQATITATLTADSSVTDAVTLNIVDITTDVSPTTLSVGSGLTQQFTAVAIPDAAPQTFIWTCTAHGVQCKNFTPAPGVSSSGLAVYTAADTCSGNCVQISAVSTVDPNGCAANCTVAKVSLVTTRVSGTYAFQFSGFDGSNNATALAGTFTASNGVITTGLEERLTASGWAKYTITGGTYTPTSSDPNNSNNAGTLTLTTGVYPNTFQVALDGAGDLEMIESDSQGTGSGIAQKSASSNVAAGRYAFGFTGVDASGNRIGYVGVLPMDGSGTIVGGQMDANDNGNATSFCGTGPCSVSGAYTADACNCGLWHMTLNAGTASLLDFDFFISSGTTSKTNPLTFYAISTDPVATHPAVSGTMVLQDSSQTYNNAAFKGTSVSALSGAAASGASNASLTLGSTDGKGNFSGQFDQNNGGSILSVAQFPPLTGANNYTYAATGTNGRYTFNLLGNPGASPVVAPLPFILYASGANSGFLLDQSSSSVMTGTMNPQGKGGGILGGSTLPGTYAVATTSSGNYGVRPIAGNSLLTSPGGTPPVYNVSGTQYQFPVLGPPGGAVTGTYTLNDLGVGTMVLTAPSAQNYVIYVVGTSGCTATNPVCQIQNFLMMDVDKSNTDPSIVFAQQ